jgi:hypothetical protein
MKKMKFPAELDLPVDRDKVRLVKHVWFQIRVAVRLCILAWIDRDKVRQLIYKRSGVDSKLQFVC